MELQAGKRWRLKNADEYLLLQRGVIEVYAVTAGQESYRQEYLFALKAGQAVFPAFDEFEEIDILIYALEDCQLQVEKLANSSKENLYPQMQEWFKQLSCIRWVKSLADLGDNSLDQNGMMLDEDIASCSELLKCFEEKQRIFSMLQGIRFLSADKRLERRQNIIRHQKERLVNDAIDNLLGEEEIFYEERNTEQRTKNLEEASFIIHLVQKSLRMGQSDISIPPESVKKLDSIGLIRRVAQKANVQLRLIKLEKNWYTKDCGTMIGYYGEKKEMAAIIPQTPGHYRLITRSMPEGIKITEDEANKLDMDAFLCYAGFPRRKMRIRDLLRFMFRQCWLSDYRTILLVSFFAGIIPLVTPVITETVFQNIIPIMDREGLVSVTQVLMVTSFTMAALSMIRSVSVMRIGSRLDMSVEAALWGRLLNMPEKFFRRFTTGELASRMRGFEALNEVLSGTFVSSVFNTLFSFWSLLLMCWYSLKLTAVAVVIWAIWCVITVAIYWRVLSYQRKLIAATNAEAGLVQQIFAGLGKFRVHGAEEQAYNLWSKVFGETWRWNLALRWQNNYNSIIGAAQPFILTMVLYYFAVYGLQDSSNTVADTEKVIIGIGYAQFLAFEAAFTAFNATLNSVIPLIGKFFSIQPHIENLRPILEEIPENTTDKVEADPLSGGIEVSHLSFAYGEDNKDVLHDISFQIAAGENVAIVGHSGCGKSTLVRLLLGFEKPRSGAIYYDGQSLAELSLPSVRSQMGVVLQNGQLMSGDIFTNIVGQAALTQDDAWEAAEAAGIADDIRAMPMGMNTVISEGSENISGGQRQRIMIARALAAKPAILIFDEATSALDNRTQSIVTESLNKLKTTRLVIAHRLSTIKECDRILVMDKGSLVESGTYEELVAKNGVFAKLVRRQVA
ncbi:NHLP bacteriocin export ABC transporter permease/ATPase subunit [Anaerovibrio lipolyticus]|uniref:NHLP bacteriocin export ABC transporter permease/ATPase subunit n=1 Tax=Anaerovibrio lipolyticus TaxID=82374 RepID=UPI0026ED56E5|nr:NHLP bacteriocin export ABC transporter permease/ATPase subunit [Anaerovibrio lipolyticus]MBE6105651.1 NHLP bacteriocin export ABC transporter permease/ATPase subunit [Anaerovibrio lipolyticus]